MSANPARSATRCDGRLSRCARISIVVEAERRRAPSRARGPPRARPRRARGPRPRSSSRSRRTRARGRARTGRSSRSARPPASATASATPVAGARLGRGDRQEAVGVLARVGRRHPRPARDLRVLAGGDDRGRCRPRASGRTAIAPSESVGATIAAMPAVWRRARRPLPRSTSCHLMRRHVATARPRDLLGRRRQARLDPGRLRRCSSPPLRRARGNPPVAPAGEIGTPAVSLIVAAYDEEAVIAAKVANALALDWPRDRLELVVAVDGGAEPGADATAERARAAGADRRARAAARRQGPRAGRGRGGVVRRAARVLRRERRLGAGRAARAARPVRATRAVGYVCGQVRFVNDAGTNQEGLYWRYEMWLRAHESALASVTAGNGAIYALRRDAYMHVDAVMGHDLSFPFNVVKRGRRAVYAPEARATEKMVPSIEGEWRAQAADDEPRVADRPARRAALPARLPAALRADDRLAPRAALRVAAAARRRGRRDARAAARRAGLPRRGARPGRAARAPPPRAAACGCGPLLVARYYVATTAALAAGPLRPPAPRHAGRRGRLPEGTR